MADNYDTEPSAQLSVIAVAMAGQGHYVPTIDGKMITHDLVKIVKETVRVEATELWLESAESTMPAVIRFSLTKECEEFY